MMAAKQKFGALTGSGQQEEPKTTKAPAARKGIQQQRKERDAEDQLKKANRDAKKGSISKKWAENKARERS